MDKTEFRIIDALSRHFNNPMTISALTREIKRLHGVAHYANIYRKIRSLTSAGIITVNEVGNASLVSLNCNNYPLVTLLAEAELRRIRDLLRERQEWQMVFDTMTTRLSQLSNAMTACLVDPERNLKLNRAELIFKLGGSAGAFGYEARAIHKKLREIQAISTIRVDGLVLGERAFWRFVCSQDKNPVREMLSNKAAFLTPDVFWTHMRNAVLHGSNVRFDSGRTHPGKISERDLVYNLSRFGYKELGSDIEMGQEICIEYIVTSLLLRGDARRREAIPVLLAKNDVDYGLLIFLSQKYGVADRLYGHLLAVADISPAGEIEKAIEFLQNLTAGEVEITSSSIESSPGSYRATR
jgi:DNA-binding transcriptional ArsR family regulator